MWLLNEKRHITANIGKLGESANFKVSTQNKHINGLISGWLGKPSLPIFAVRYAQFKKITNKNK